MKKWIYFFSLLLISTAVFAQQYNFDFEKVKGNFPKDWWSYKVDNYNVALERYEVYQGKYALCISSNKNYVKSEETASYQPVVHRSVPYNFEGSRIKVTGYIKTENVSDKGWAGFFINAMPYAGFVNMRGQNVTGTTDWTKYELETVLKDEAYDIVIGVLLAEQGKVWVDDMKVYIDGVLLENVPKKEISKENNWKYYYYRANLNYLDIVRPKKEKDTAQVVDSTYQLLDKAIALTQKDNLHLKTATVYQLRGLYASKKDSMSDSKVTESYYRALEFAKKTNKKEDQLEFLIDIANLHFFSGNYEKSIQLREEVMHHLHHVKLRSVEEYFMLLKKQNISLVTVSNELSEDYLKIQNSEMARKYNQLSFDEVNDSTLSEYYDNQFYTKWAVNKNYHILEGKLHWLEGNNDSAKKSFLQAFRKDPKDNSVDELFKIQKFYYFSKVAVKENDYQKAVDLLEQGKPQDVSVFQRYSNYDDYYLLLAKSYSKLKKEEQANQYLQTYIEIVEKNRKSKNELTRKVQQEEIAQVQEELVKLEASKHMTERQLWYGGSLILLLLIASARRIYVTNKRNKKRFKAVLKKLEQKESQLVLNTGRNTQIHTEYNLKQELIDALKKGLKRIEKTEYFLRKECTQVAVAKKLKTNTAYLSKFMNSQYGFGFNTYLNNLRIHYAIQRLKNDKIFRSYTVQAISEELGYKSSNTFTKAFKKETGLLPSYYIKELNLIEGK
jgi:YesN/AraC family two-component response regulator